MCPPSEDTEKPQVMLLGPNDNLSFPSDSGNRWNSFCIAWVSFVMMMLLWSYGWEISLALSVSRYSLPQRKAMHCCFMLLLCLGFCFAWVSFLVHYFYKTQFGCQDSSPSFSSVLLLGGLFLCLFSGTPECHLVTSKPFNRIVLKFFISWESFNSGPINSKCLFYSDNRQSLTYPRCFS